MTPGYFQRVLARTVVVCSVVLLAPALSAQSQKPAPPAAAPQAQPAEAIKLTIEDAVRRALDQNPDLAVVKLGTDAEAERVSEAQSAYRPVFVSTFGQSNLTVPSANPLTGAAGFEQSDLFSSAGIRQRLQWGAGTYSVSWDGARTATNSLFSTFEPSLQSGLLVAFSQPLLRDRKMDSAKLQNVITQRNLKSSEVRVREATVQTAAAVKTGTGRSRRPGPTSRSSSARSSSRKIRASEPRAGQCRAGAAARSAPGRSRGGDAAGETDSRRRSGGGRRGSVASAHHGSHRLVILARAPGTDR